MTERLVAERKAGRSLFGINKNPFSHHPCVRAVMDATANVNVLVHVNKLLAVGENGPAYELDSSESLSSICKIRAAESSNLRQPTDCRT